MRVPRCLASEAFSCIQKLKSSGGGGACPQSVVALLGLELNPQSEDEVQRGSCQEPPVSSAFLR